MAQSGKNFIRRLLCSKLFLLLISVLLIFLTISLGKETYRRHQLTQEIKGLESEIERLEGRNKQIADLMEYLKEESYLEKEARLKLNLKKPGEKVVILAPSDSKGGGSAEGSPAVQEKKEANDSGISSVSLLREKANWWKWWEYFFSP